MAEQLVCQNCGKAIEYGSYWCSKCRKSMGRYVKPTDAASRHDRYLGSRHSTGTSWWATFKQTLRDVLEGL